MSRSPASPRNLELIKTAASASTLSQTITGTGPKAYLTLNQKLTLIKLNEEKNIRQNPANDIVHSCTLTSLMAETSQGL